MANCRFLTSFTVETGVNDVVRMTHSTGGAADVTIDSGTYYWSLDNDTTAGQKDFGAALESAFFTAFDPITLSATIYNVNVTNTAIADGRVRYAANAGTIQFNFGHANNTMDPRIFGFAASATDKPATAAASIASEFTHRYGWYPQTSPAFAIVRESNRRSYVEYSTGGYVDGAKRSTTDYEFDARLDFRPSALIRTAAAAVSARATSVLTTVGDPNISLEAWAGDCQDTSAKWRFYEVITSYSAADYVGPYRFREGSYLWTRPADGEPSSPLGELWTRDIDGVTARG